MKIEQWKIDRVKPYEKNPRRNDQAVEAVMASIREFGFRQPIVVDAEGVIVVGHTRWKAAKKLKLKTVPVHVAKDLTPEQARAYRLADNRTAEGAKWDVELLPIELGELRDSGFDLKLIGFTEKELAEHLGQYDTGLGERAEWEERVGICVNDGGLCETEAEAVAWEQVGRSPRGYSEN